MVDSDAPEPGALPPDDPEADPFGLLPFGCEVDDQGISLEELGKTYAQLVDKGKDPYDSDQVDDRDDRVPASTVETEAGAQPAKMFGAFDDQAEEISPDETEPEVELCPRSILEAVLFVGHPNGDPIQAADISGMMRGVPAREVKELVDQLNVQYAHLDHPYRIVSREAGYRLELRPEFASLRDVFYGRVREARLSQAAIDVLAIVAYEQGCTKDDIDSRRGRPSRGLLSQLVRRRLLRIERPQANPRRPQYFTTDRFLALFQLETLDDLPTAQDLE